MRLLHRLRLRLLSLFRPSQVEQELDAELQFHMEQQIEENRAAGLSEKDAYRAARRKFGSIALAKDQARDTWGAGFLDNLWRDLCFGANRCLKPGDSRS